MMESVVEADALYFKADELLNEKKYAESKMVLDEVLKIEPGHVLALNALGWLYERKYYDYEKAKKCYLAALRLNPSYISVYVNYAYLLATIDNYEEFERHVSAALEVPGVNRSRLYGEWGVVKEKQGDLAAAEEKFRMAISHCLSNEDVKMYKDDIARLKMKAELW